MSGDPLAYLSRLLDLAGSLIDGVRPPAAAIGGDWAAAFRTGAAGLRAAWQQAGDLSQEADLPIGRVPKSFVASQQIAEFAVHCWDLAAATGQRADFPAGACEAALAWARTALLRPAPRVGCCDSGVVIVWMPSQPTPRGSRSRG